MDTSVYQASGVHAHPPLATLRDCGAERANDAYRQSRAQARGAIEAAAATVVPAKKKKKGEKQRRIDRPCSSERMTSALKMGSSLWRKA